MRTSKKVKDGIESIKQEQDSIKKKFFKKGRMGKNMKCPGFKKDVFPYLEKAHREFPG